MGRESIIASDDESGAEIDLYLRPRRMSEMVGQREVFAPGATAGLSSSA